MPTNKNAQLRYRILDRCFSDFHRTYSIEDLLDTVNESLMDLYGSQVSIRQMSADPTKPSSMNPFLNIIRIFAEESCLSRCYPVVKRHITIKLSVNKTF